MFGVKEGCALLGLPRATVYWLRRPKTEPVKAYPRADPANSLSPEERRHFLGLAHSELFIDKTPYEIYYSLLDQGEYLCSPSTMYRILRESGEVRERREQRRLPTYQRPELLATAPCQLWSWDITWLRGPSRGTWYYLYVLLDVFSRLVVGWLLANRESEEFSKMLLEDSYIKHDIKPGQITAHSDRGPSMTAQGVTEFMGKLGIEQSLSRPYTSDDNPYSEAQFKTLKYRPLFPDRFGCHEDTLGHLRGFFPWYNDEHYHSGLCWLTPADVHYGRGQEILAVRHQTLMAAYHRHPKRFLNGPPRLKKLPEKVWINKPFEEVYSANPHQ